MALLYSRDEFLDRLNAEIAKGKPLVMAGAGNGISAKFIERGGADIIGVYNTGYFRMQGYGSLAGMLPMADANELVYRMGAREVLPQVRHTPVIAGLNGVDVLRNMPLFLEECRRIGFSGVHNFPTVAWFQGEFRETLEATGLGYQMEIDMLNTARKQGLLTIGYAFNEADTETLMRGAAPDIFIFHAGITKGGSTGFARGRSLEETADRTRTHFQLAKRIKSDVILLAHGAALVNPEDGQYLIDHTQCHGIQVGSSIERLAIEKPLEERAAAFKEMRFRTRGHSSQL
ncbi:MAG: phosphoenolpyruvate hydrolase family protein [Bryobacteraceae bacterium]